MFNTEAVTPRLTADALKDTIRLMHIVNKRGRFQSLKCARDALSSIGMFLLYIPAQGECDASLLDLLTHWWQAFAPFLHMPDDDQKLQSRYKAGVSLLLMQFQVLNLEAATRRRDGRYENGGWPPSMETYCSIFSPANSVIKAAYADFKDHGPGLFHLDVGIGPLLFQVMLRSREYYIRRTCLTLMGSWPSQDGVFNGKSLYKVAEKLCSMCNYEHYLVRAAPGQGENQLSVVVFRIDQCESPEAFFLLNLC